MGIVDRIENWSVSVATPKYDTNEIAKALKSYLS